MTGAMILFGSSLFFIYALPSSGPGAAVNLRWSRPLIVASASLVLAGAVLGFFAQTIWLAGSVHDGLQLDTLGAVVTGMSFGKSSCVRAAITVAFIAAYSVSRPAWGWWLAAAAGGVIAASFAWMGHGAATKGAAGAIHLVGDIVHTWAAGVWVGALVAFLVLLATDARRSAATHAALHRALHGFAGVGSALVAVLIVTGLINAWFLVGLAGAPQLLTGLYGQLLTVKLGLFLLMLGLAAANRFHLTPRLGAALDGPSPPEHALAALRRSLAVETALSIVVLGLVAWFGMLAPPSAS